MEGICLGAATMPGRAKGALMKALRGVESFDMSAGFDSVQDEELLSVMGRE